MQANAWSPPLDGRSRNVNINAFCTITKKYRTRNNGKIMRYNETVETTAPEIIRAEKFRLNPSPQQHEILQTWFGLFRSMYNATIDYIEPRLFQDNKLVENYRRVLNKFAIRAALKNQKEALAKQNGKNIIPIHSLDQAILTCVAMYKSSVSNHERREYVRQFKENERINKYIEKQTKNKQPIANIKPRPAPTKKPFQMHHIKASKPQQFMIIEGSAFSQVHNAFAYSILGEMASKPERFNTSQTCTLTYDSRKSRYILAIPRKYESRTYESRNLTCGIDPGIRTFLTVYSRYECYEINPKINFQAHFAEIDDVYKKYKSGKLKKRYYKNIIAKINDKIHNNMKDIHYKVAAFLCYNYRVIKIGKINVKSIVRKNKKTGEQITAFNKKKLYALSHYTFRQILKSQAEKYGCQVEEINEYMTTKTCSACGDIKEVGKEEIYNCDNPNCRLEIGRDINAAKNIRFKEPRVWIDATVKKK